VKANEDIAELLQKSLTLDEPTTTAQRVPIASSNDADESTMLVGSSDSSVEGYTVFIFNSLLNVLKKALKQFQLRSNSTASGRPYPETKS
jgi:hypothetical protein